MGIKKFVLEGVLCWAAVVAAGVAAEEQLGQGKLRGLQSVPEFCNTIKDTWWSSRDDYENYYPYTNPSMRAYCANFSKANAENPNEWTADVCYDATPNPEVSLVICTIEGHGNPDVCVPTNCAHLNQGECNFENTGGMCQWFEFVPTPGDLSKNQGRGCYRNPCHMGGQPYNNANYCNTDADFIEFNAKHNPSVTCEWCGTDQMGCQNNDPNPKSGCAAINSKQANDLAKKNAENGNKEGCILTISSSNPKYSEITVCNDATKVTSTGKPAECFYGQNGCGEYQLNNGFSWKYQPQVN